MFIYPNHTNYISFSSFCDLMKSLGKVVSLSEGKLVLKTDSLVKIGSKVFDERGNFVGIVEGYFGPVMGPYLLIGPKGTGNRYLGKQLYGSGGKK